MVCEGWKGLIVDGKFPLLECRGEWADQCVFLTVRESTQIANIKLVQASGVDADACVSSWEMAKSLPHPCLVQMMETGKSQLDSTDLAYVVTEKANTFLSRVIPRESLDTNSLKEILIPVVDALAFLHEKEFVHGSVKPPSIVLIGDDWKLSTDEMARAGDSLRRRRELDRYDAPEVGAAVLTAAADLWSLGIIVLEACSQQTPVWSRDVAGDRAVPEWLPQPFREIARECLRWDPASRISIAQVKELLNRDFPLSAAASTAVAGEREAIVLDTAAARSEPELQTSRPEPELFETIDGDELSPRSRLFASMDEEDEKSGKGALFFVLIILLGVGGFLALRYSSTIRAWIGSQRASVATQPAAPTQSANQKPAEAASESTQPATPNPPQATIPESQTSSGQAASQGSTLTPSQTSPSPAPAQEPESSVASRPEPAPKAASATEESESRDSREAGLTNARGEIAKKVTPNVARGAIESMRRPVQVDVRVLVNRNGKVSSARCLTQAPGNYFAKISQQAAESWRFKAPVRDGETRESEWKLQFRFTRGHTEVAAVETQ